ncbi:lytic transglycosylase domain-containing protein [bacterium]|nr:lytic transglycosylase domain-containing protein [bacterium]
MPIFFEPVFKMLLARLRQQQFFSPIKFNRLTLKFHMVIVILCLTGCSFIEQNWLIFHDPSPREETVSPFVRASASKSAFSYEMGENNSFLLPRFDRVRPVEVLQEYERLQGRHGRDLENALKRAIPYFDSFGRILEKHLIPTDMLIIPFVESHFRSQAVSQKGAAGLWQFTRATGRHYGLRVNLFGDERKDPDRSTDAAAQYLYDLYLQFGDWPLALAAYNCGAARVRRACKGELVCDYWKLIRKKALPPQTRKYVPRLLASLLYLEDRELWPFTKARGR